jgi:hypothetical protein
MPFETPAVDASVLLHVGGNSGDDVRGPLGFFGAQMPMVVDGFPSFYLLDDVVNRCQTQGLVPVRGVNSSFNLGSTFAASGEASNEVVYFRHSGSLEGWQKQTVS